MSEIDGLDALYNRELLRWAAKATGAGRLPAPDGTSTRSSPVCGDRVRIDVTRDADGRATAIAQDARACALCQASATMLAERGIGADAVAAHTLADTVRALLKADGPPPDAPFEVWSLFAPVRDHKSRHGCVLLPLDAFAEALDAAAG